MNQSKKLVGFLLFFATAGNIGCGPSPTDSARTQQKDQAGEQPKNPSNQPENPRPQTHSPSFQYVSVIREFEGTDTASLFGILPDQGTSKIESVRGPAFLGPARVGKLDKEAMNYLFMKSSVPMLQTEREDLAAKYFGAQVIYFEGYNGHLCLGPDEINKIDVLSSLGDLKVTTTFEFSAVATSKGACKFHKLSTLSQF